MEPPTTGQKAIGHDESPGHTWRVSQLERLGVPGPLAEIYADCIDWHQIARLVRRGCPPRLALRDRRLTSAARTPAMTARANWRDDAACRDADPDLFFPIGAAGPALRQISEAKRICRACPARTPCLAWALENGVTDGVWGATTPDERRAIRSLPRRTTTSQEDDDGEGYQPAEHAGQEIRAQAAQGKATRIFSGARAGDGPSGTGAKVTADVARRQRFRGLVISNVRPLGTAADVAQAIAGQLHFIRSAGVHEDRSSSYPVAASPGILLPRTAKGSG